MRAAKDKMAYIATAVLEGNYRYTVHGAQQRVERRLKRKDIEQVLLNGEIIEDYPSHHYGPACLVYGITAESKVLHIVCSLRETIDIITVYEPDTDEWENDLKVRRTKK